MARYVQDNYSTPTQPNLARGGVGPYIHTLTCLSMSMSVYIPPQARSKTKPNHSTQLNSTNPNPTKPNQMRPNQTQTNLIKPNPTKPNQTKTNQAKLWIVVW